MSHQELAAKTDLCVKCGLCLPHCPTYLHTRDENESPRGRLSLIQGWARDELQATPKLTGHVDNCLLCRACEAVCPAYVPYGQIIDSFRAETPRNKTLSGKLKSGLLHATLTHPKLAPLSRNLLSGPSAPLLKTLARLAGAGKLTEGLPSTTGSMPTPPGIYPAIPTETGHAALFTGCTGDLLDRETLAAAIKVMTHLGIRVRIPETQACCGALDQHDGETNTAKHLIEQNLSAFGTDETETIVSIASGCGAMLREYDQTASSEPSTDFSRRVQDISQFLMSLTWPEDLQLKPLKAVVCLHTPCSLKNILRADSHAATLLKRIPELKAVALPAQTRCCGAAGSYMLDYPEMADTLRDEILDQIAAAQPSLLVTSNPGCAMHLRAGLKQRGLDIEIVHPVTMLARQLAD